MANKRWQCPKLGKPSLLAGSLSVLASIGHLDVKLMSPAMRHAVAGLLCRRGQHPICSPDPKS
jgi:hypothetical protein